MENPERVTYFGATDARGKKVPFGIKAKDRERHTYIIGKTGMGKSTLLENMAIQDIRNGEGIAFIDPHGGTAEKLLEYIPPERVGDVVYFAPFDMENPIAFNIMEDVGYDRRHLVVSGLMSAFKKLWVDAWSARMEYILTNTLLALLEYPDSTLLSVNRMYTDKAYRKKVVENVKDPVVKDFWVKEFAGYGDRYTQEATPAIQNKIGQFTGNPLIRNIIGQPKSSFDIREMMDKKKILIINLSKGLVGETNMQLLGSMLTTRIFLAAMSRANLPHAELDAAPKCYFYVDEFQNFANETFAGILSEARKYKLALTIAHQYVEQMEEEVRDAVFGNVGTTIAFRVGPFDAETLETVFMPEFTKEDLVNLGLRQIYLSLMIDGIGSRPFSAVTLPPIEPPPRIYKDEVVASSRAQFGAKRSLVEAKISEELADVDTEYVEPAPKPKRPYTKSTPSSSLPTRDGVYVPQSERPRPVVRATEPAPRVDRLEHKEERVSVPRDNARPHARREESRSQSRREERPAPVAASKSPDDLRAILKRMTEGQQKKEEPQTTLKETLGAVVPKQPNPVPTPAPNPMRESQSRPQQATAQKPYEVPEDELRKILKDGV
ncbi:MAG: type IV secretion system DNA-binding domain-containing protein [Candidatus Pacebacteria bacterium]|nr:type IV secretion system DNA-binding domain-containing protein [Candidatus Paceibacterota bacterium]MBP9840738.1 type IV secretion system DNA-binding domain-containing protein [Candidatus Paceibacterota bacterium]